MMQLNEVLSRLREPDAREALRPHWDESEATFPDHLPSFLTPAEFKRSREWGGFGPEVEPILERTARRIASDPVLLHLAWHGYRLTYEHSDYRALRNWPHLEHALGDDRSVFYLLLSLAAVPRIRAAHQARGIPERVTGDTCLDVRIIADRYHHISGGQLGIESARLNWFRLIASGDLHRLGCMQYVVRPFRGQMRVYQEHKTHRTLALSEAGIHFDGEGQVAADPDAKNTWTSRLTEETASVTGSPVSPYGMALPDEITLPRNDWSCVLSAGDPVLEMHIPKGDSMTLEACRSSMQQALDFFPAYYPDLSFVAFACYSWILNTQLEEMLPPTSNLLRFQHQVYLFPRPSSGKDGLYFIFCTGDVDIKTAPRDTTLKRAILDHLAAGKRLRNGGMFMLTDDFRHFGTQQYRSQSQACPP